VTPSHSFLIHQFLCLPYLHKPLLHKSPYCLLPPRQGMNAVDIRIEIPLDHLALSIPVPAQSVDLFHKFSKNYPLHSMLNSLLCSWQCHCMMVLSVGQIFE
jgi:hypothetical protein